MIKAKTGSPWSILKFGLDFENFVGIPEFWMNFGCISAGFQKNVVQDFDHITAQRFQEKLQ